MLRETEQQQHAESARVDGQNREATFFRADELHGESEPEEKREDRVGLVVHEEVDEVLCVMINRGGGQPGRARVAQHHILAAQPHHIG